MSLRGKQYLSLAVMAAGFLMIAIFRDWLSALGVFVVLAGIVLALRLLRCPTCGAPLWPHPGQFCKRCGAKIEWDKKGS